MFYITKLKIVSIFIILLLSIPSLLIAEECETVIINKNTEKKYAWFGGIVD